MRNLVRVAAFECRRFLRDRYSRVALAAFVLVAAAGAYFYWRSLPPRPPGSRLFGDAYILALVIAYHAGLARDRMYQFDRYLMANFSDERDFYFGHLLATLGALVLFALTAFAVGVALALGDVGFAAYYAQKMLYVSLLMLPLLIALELLLNSRTPVPLVLVMFFVLALLWGRANDTRQFYVLLGIELDLRHGGAWLRVAIALALSAGLYPLFRLRSGRVSLALR